MNIKYSEISLLYKCFYSISADCHHLVTGTVSCLFYIHMFYHIRVCYRALLLYCVWKHVQNTFSLYKQSTIEPPGWQIKSCQVQNISKHLNRNIEIYLDGAIESSKVPGKI